MAHIVVPAAEAILDKEFPVLNHGFVRLVDYLGGDARIVQAARVS
ncbi:MAG: thymidylate synthase (FAD), partial [Nitrospinota bacterium]